MREDYVIIAQVIIADDWTNLLIAFLNSISDGLGCTYPRHLMNYVNIMRDFHSAIF